MSYRGRVLQVKWPNQQCQSTEGSNGPKDFNPTRSTSPCYNTTHAYSTYTQMNLSTVKLAQWDKTQSRELLVLFICMCSSLCTIVAHNIAQNRPDNFPSYPPDNHHCSDDVYLREGGYWNAPYVLTTRLYNKCMMYVCCLMMISIMMSCYSSRFQTTLIYVTSKELIIN